MLVADERVVEFDFLFEHVEQMVTNTALEPEQDVQIAQTDVRVDKGHTRAALGQRRAEICGGRRLADAALTRRNDDRAPETHRRGGDRRCGGIVGWAERETHQPPFPTAL